MFGLPNQGQIFTLESTLYDYLRTKITSGWHINLLYHIDIPACVHSTVIYPSLRTGS